MPIASPTNTDANRTPYAALPPPRLAAYKVAEPTTVPPAANAPTMPVTSPRTSGVRATNDAPSRSMATSPGPAALRCVARPEISGMKNQTVSAMTRYATPLMTRATKTVGSAEPSPPRKPPTRETMANRPDAVMTATP
jgi:hypothetical protein